MTRFLRILAALSLLACLITSPVAAEEQSLGDAGTISFQAPSGWVSNAVSIPGRDGKPMGCKFLCRTEANGGANGQVTVALAPKAKVDAATIKERLLASIEPFAADSLEKKPEPKPLASTQGTGFYVFLTDARLAGRTSGPGEFKILCSALIHLNDEVIVIASLLCQDANGPELKAMLQALSNLRLSAGKST